MDEEAPVPFKQYFPKLSMSSYFWIVIFASMIVFGILGYFVGVRVSELPLSDSTTGASSQTPLVSSQIQPTVNPYDDNDIDYSSIRGIIIVNTDYYDQFVVSVNGLPTASTAVIDADDRSFDKPHIGIQYPYMFSRLNPSTTYVVSASACRTNPLTFALDCAKNIKITKCSGAIQGNTCVIKGSANESKSSGLVDFLLPDATNSAKKGNG